MAVYPPYYQETLAAEKNSFRNKTFYYLWITVVMREVL